jgi:hypothetical protein
MAVLSKKHRNLEDMHKNCEVSYNSLRDELNDLKTRLA